MLRRMKNVIDGKVITVVCIQPFAAYQFILFIRNLDGHPETAIVGAMSQLLAAATTKRKSCGKGTWVRKKKHAVQTYRAASEVPLQISGKVCTITRTEEFDFVEFVPNNPISHLAA